MFVWSPFNRHLSNLLRGPQCAESKCIYQGTCVRVYSNCPIVTCWRWLARKSESVQHLTQQRRIPRRVTAIVAAYVRVCVCATHRGTYACMNLPLCTVCGSTSRTQGFLRGRLAVTYARTRRIGFVVCPCPRVCVCVLVQINM